MLSHIYVDMYIYIYVYMYIITLSLSVVMVVFDCHGYTYSANVYSCCDVAVALPLLLRLHVAVPSCESL